MGGRVNYRLPALSRAATATITILLLICVAPGARVQAQDRSGVTRTYYIAADEVDWDYLPSGRDKMMGMATEGYAKAYTTRGAHLIGKVYRKALYREYTDATFEHQRVR